MNPTYCSDNSTSLSDTLSVFVFLEDPGMKSSLHTAVLDLRLQTNPAYTGVVLSVETQSLAMYFLQGAAAQCPARLMNAWGIEMKSGSSMDAACC